MRCQDQPGKPANSTTPSDTIEQRAQAIALLAEKKPGEAMPLFTQLSSDRTLTDF